MKTGDRVRIAIADHSAYSGNLGALFHGRTGTLESFNARSINNIENGKLGPAWLVRLDIPVERDGGWSPLTHFWFPQHELTLAGEP